MGSTLFSLTVMDDRAKALLATGESVDVPLTEAAVLLAKAAGQGQLVWWTACTAAKPTEFTGTKFVFWVPNRLGTALPPAAEAETSLAAAEGAAS